MFFLQGSLIQAIESGSLLSNLVLSRAGCGILVGEILGCEILVGGDFRKNLPHVVEALTSNKFRTWLVVKDFDTDPARIPGFE